MAKLLSFLILIIGVGLLSQVVIPIVNFNLLTRSLAFDDRLLVSPQLSLQQEGGFPQIISNTKRAYAPSYSNFKLSVPDLKINDGLVYVESNDLNLGLIHMPGSALPGEKGNVFISGHSLLPVFEKGGVGIFARLPEAKIGQIVSVTVLGTKYNYKISQIKVINPTDLSVISPPDSSGRYLTMMTCVPPGLNTKRLVVLAKMI